MGIAENIRQRRKGLKMSQDDLANAIGSNRVTISRYETGAYFPSVAALEKLAFALNTTPNELMGDDKPPDETPKSIEARIISGGVDRLPKEQREQALSVMRAMFAQYADYFKERTEDHDTEL